MHYFALATDFDGTLATNGRVNETTIEALKRLRESGRKLLLVTGRHLDDVCEVFPEFNLFDCIVAENGALLYFPDTKEEQLLGDRPPEKFIEALRSRQVQPLGVGKVIVSTWEPNEIKVLETIRELGLELQIIFNKGAVMILPSGINKAAGLKAALTRFGLSLHNVVAIGDAENDLSFLKTCELSVAVNNALPMVKEQADWVTQKDRGEGVIELIDTLISSDLEELSTSNNLNRILLGHREEEEISFNPYGASLMLAGTSGGGKSTLATAILERLTEQEYQFCIIDPEGDYESFEGVIVLGNSKQAPSINEIMGVLDKPNQNLVINMLGIALDQRPSFFASLLPAILELRSRTGRPHWLVVDEAHHMLPSQGNSATLTIPQFFNGILLITVHPQHVDKSALSLVNTMIAVGKSVDKTIAEFCEPLESCPPNDLPKELPSEEALIWFRDSQQEAIRLQIIPPRTERHRHMRNYAEGNLGDDKCFIFRGAEGKLKLRAQNLITFMQLAEGIDDETWLYHLQQQDYSRWLREAIKDEKLAEETAEVEKTENISAQESRDRIKTAIDERYTLPA
jgi:HAD superfamily hydrolase (TIGR01484 family)